jgi:hypothetical protein
MGIMANLYTRWFKGKLFWILDAKYGNPALKQPPEEDE